MEQTIGIDIDGVLHKFNLEFCSHELRYCIITCSYKELTELIIPMGVVGINCEYNKFNRNLTLPESIEYVFCDRYSLDNLNKYKHLKYIHIDYK